MKPYFTKMIDLRKVYIPNLEASFMRTIFKYPVAHGDPYTEMPVGAKIVKVGIQNDRTTVWAEVYPKNNTEKRNFKVYGTGHEIPEESVYVGTFFHEIFVWHLYEEPLLPELYE